VKDIIDKLNQGYREEIDRQSKALDQLERNIIVLREVIATHEQDTAVFEQESWCDEERWGLANRHCYKYSRGVPFIRIDEDLTEGTIAHIIINDSPRFEAVYTSSDPRVTLGAITTKMGAWGETLGNVAGVICPAALTAQRIMADGPACGSEAMAVGAVSSLIFAGVGAVAGGVTGSLVAVAQNAFRARKCQGRVSVITRWEDVPENGVVLAEMRRALELTESQAHDVSQRIETLRAQNVQSAIDQMNNEIQRAEDRHRRVQKITDFRTTVSETFDRHRADIESCVRTIAKMYDDAWLERGGPEAIEKCVSDGRMSTIIAGFCRDWLEFISQGSHRPNDNADMYREIDQASREAENGTEAFRLYQLLP
jgi:DNA-binding transcriptional MerR regulator